MTPDSIVIVVAILGVGVALGTLILTTTHRAEVRLNKRIDAIEEDISDSEARLRDEIKASETRLREELTAVETRTSAEIKASESRTSAKFEEVNEQMRIGQARADASFADVNEQLRTTNDRMTSIERQQARLGGLLEGLREALFERARR